MADTKRSLDVGVINQIINYLATRPYQEVFQLIQALATALERKGQPKKGGKVKETKP